MQAKSRGRPTPPCAKIGMRSGYEENKLPTGADRTPELSSDSECAQCLPNTRTMHRPPEKLPDPWLFDSEKLLRELDRCRELVLKIPAPTHEAHFAVNTAITAIWN